MSERDLTAAMAAEVVKSGVCPILLAEIETASGTTRAWTGYGDLTWDGKTWGGAGAMGKVSPVTESTDLYAHGLTFSLSGVPTEMLALVLDDARQGLPCNLWIGLLEIAGDQASLVEDPYLLFSGLSDVPSIDEDGATATVSVTAESRLIRLETPNVRRYTPEDQAIDFPDDRGFDFVAGLQDAEIPWGRG